MIDSIVVGVDGSAHADHALRYAVEEAVAHGAALTVVFAHVHPRTLALGDHPGPSSWAWLDEEGLHRAAQHELDAAIERARVPSGVEVTPLLVEASPVRALLATVDEVGADLLVIGSRGRGGFRGLLLGSTSQQVAAHASCPVVVVPVADQDGTGAEEEPAADGRDAAAADGRDVAAAVDAAPDAAADDGADAG